MVKDYWANCFSVSTPKYYFARHNGKSSVESQNWFENAYKTQHWYDRDDDDTLRYTKLIQEVIAKSKLTTEQARDGMRVFAAHFDEFYIDTGVNPHIDIEGLLNLLEEETE